MFTKLSESHEWLETDGLGGFAMGTATGVRTRRYHSILTSSLRPPGDRVALVKGLDAWIETPEGVWGLSTHRYAGGHESPDGVVHFIGFTTEPWPTWRFRLPTGLIVEHELFMTRGKPVVFASWRAIGPMGSVQLTVRPVLAATDVHTLRSTAESMSLGVRLGSAACAVQWRPDERMPVIAAAPVDGAYVHDPALYYRVLYTEERARGFDHTEDLGSPGVFRWDLGEGEAALMLSAGVTDETSDEGSSMKRERFERARSDERAVRASIPSRIDRAADQFLVSRGDGRTIIAGYPWFGDWGRDTFIAMRGLCLARGKWDESRRILVQWAGAVSEGMLPNRFTDNGDTPEFNSVDASLWYVIAAGEYLDAVDGWGGSSGGPGERTIRGAIGQILEGYARGTRYRIGMDTDGLLRAGEPGVQLTWMDARANGVEVTPRIGKPVEVQALWANALHFGATLDTKWAGVLARVRTSFGTRFWNDDLDCLFDVVDADHVAGRSDPAIRPNQLFAVGGLPFALVEGQRAASVVHRVERDLLTPVGLRSLAPTEPGYRPRYEGGPTERDCAYHQGTVWPWLTGAFIEAWMRIRGNTPEAAAEAHERFIAPMELLLDEGGLGSVSEIYDAEPARLPRGCPFQAWSVGELIRVSGLIASATSELGPPAVQTRAARPRMGTPAIPYS